MRTLIALLLSCLALTAAEKKPKPDTLTSPLTQLLEKQLETNQIYRAEQSKILKELTDAHTLAVSRGIDSTPYYHRMDAQRDICSAATSAHNALLLRLLNERDRLRRTQAAAKATNAPPK